MTFVGGMLTLAALVLVGFAAYHEAWVWAGINLVLAYVNGHLTYINWEARRR